MPEDSATPVEDNTEYNLTMKDTSTTWFEVRDAKSKKLFYFNNVTQVSQWNRPEGVKIIPINQVGNAVVLGSGIIEKDYSSNPNSRLGPQSFINGEDHIVDPIQCYQKDVFDDKDQLSESTVVGESERSPA